MNWNERGVLQSSRIYYFKPMETLSKGLFYLSCFGVFDCDSKYCVHRKIVHSPLLMYITDGQIKINVNGQAFIAHDNDIVLLDCQSEHQYKAIGHCSFYFFHFNGANSIQLIDEITKINGGPVISLANSQWFDFYISALSVRLANPESPDEFELSGFVYAVLGKLNSDVQPLIHEVKQYTKLIIQAQNYIRLHVTENVTLFDIADSLNISKDYLSHLFQQKLKCSPIAYHAQCRIEYAKSILLYSTASISEISEFLGFSSSASFINSFKAHCNITPLQYRKRRLK